MSLFVKQCKQKLINMCLHIIRRALKRDKKWRYVEFDDETVSFNVALKNQFHPVAYYGWAICRIYRIYVNIN